MQAKPAMQGTPQQGAAKAPTGQGVVKDPRLAPKAMLQASASFKGDPAANGGRGHLVRQNSENSVIKGQEFVSSPAIGKAGGHFEGKENEKVDAPRLMKADGQASQAEHKKPQPMPEDEFGHYQVKVGNKIDFTPPFSQGRYTIVKLLGSGTYGKVVRCEDHKYNRAPVAVKLVRREPQLYRVSAKNEIAILRELGGRCGTVKILRDFEHQGHICMTFELLGDHLSQILHKHGAFKLDTIRDVAFQLLQAVSYIHSKNIIHTDLKAENILFMHNTTGAMTVKVADFGSAIMNNAWHPPLVGTMHYRAPEAVLQAGWSHPLDVWAVACLIVELCTGTYLFELAYDDVHLQMMERLLGPIPADLLRRGYQNMNQYNKELIQQDSQGKIRLSPCRKEGYQQIMNMRRLKDVVPHPTLLNLIRHMLEFDPNQRITAHKALMHPFFDIEDAEDSVEVSRQAQEASDARRRPSTSDAAAADNTEGAKNSEGTKATIDHAYKDYKEYTSKADTSGATPLESIAPNLQLIANQTESESSAASTAPVTQRGSENDSNTPREMENTPPEVISKEPEPER
jgi:serine/threonine protein kinase